MGDREGLWIVIIFVLVAGVLLTIRQVAIHHLDRKMDTIKEQILEGEGVSGQKWFSIPEKYRYKILHDLPEYRKFEREYILER